MLAEMRYALNRRRAGTDDAYALVSQLVQAAGGIAAGIVVIPTAGVEGVPFELSIPGIAGSLGR